MNDVGFNLLIDANPGAVKLKDAYGCLPKDLAALNLKSMLA